MPHASGVRSLRCSMTPQTRVSTSGSPSLSVASLIGPDSSTACRISQILQSKTYSPSISSQTLACGRRGCVLFLATMNEPQIRETDEGRISEADRSERFVVCQVSGAVRPDVFSARSNQRPSPRWLRRFPCNGSTNATMRRISTATHDAISLDSINSRQPLRGDCASRELATLRDRWRC